MALWLRDHGMQNVIAVKTGKAAALRIVVPEIELTKPFEDTPESDLRMCLDAVQELTNYANMLEDTKKVDFSKRKK